MVVYLQRPKRNKHPIPMHRRMGGWHRRMGGWVNVGRKKQLAILE
jgi:hypothetical protein